MKQREENVERHFDVLVFCGRTQNESEEKENICSGNNRLLCVSIRQMRDFSKIDNY